MKGIQGLPDSTRYIGSFFERSKFNLKTRVISSSYNLETIFGLLVHPDHFVFQKIVIFEKNQAFAVGRGLVIFAKTAKNAQKTKNPVKTGFLLFAISRTTKRSF